MLLACTVYGLSFSNSAPRIQGSEKHPKKTLNHREVRSFGWTNQCMALDEQVNKIHPVTMTFIKRFTSRGCLD